MPKVIDESTPNATLERLIFNNGYRAFGKKVTLDKDDLTWLRNELNRRNRNGEYVFKSRAERKRLTFKKGLVPQRGETDEIQRLNRITIA